MQQLNDIRRLVRRVRWRLRWQLALRRVLAVGGVALFAFGAVVLLVKTRAVSTEWTAPAGATALGVAALGLLSGLLRRLDDVRLAAALDASAALHSRLGTALAFAQPDRAEAPPAGSVQAEFERAALEDAATVLAQAHPRLAAPWRWGTFALGTAVAVGALALAAPAVFVLNFPVGRRVALGASAPGPSPAPFARIKVALDAEEVAALEAQAEAFARPDADRVTPEVQRFLGALEALVRALAAGALTPEEAFAELAALEQARDAWQDAHADAIDQAVTELQEAAVKRTASGEDFGALLAALRQQALDEAARTLDAAADRTGEGALDRKAADRLARDAAALASALESARQAAERDARRERDRLRDKERGAPERLTARERDRLKDKERELERLGREGEEFAEAQRQLERLQRELGAAAEDLRRRLAEGGDTRASAEELRKAAEMLRRLQEQAAGRKAMGASEGQLGALRELLRRAAQRQGSGDGGGGGGPEGALERFSRQARGEGTDGGSPAGQSGSGDGTKPGGEGAGGEPSALTVGEGGSPGGEGLVLLGPSPGSGGAKPGTSAGEAGGETQPGEGVGQGHDARILGDKTSLDAETRDDFVAGAQGQGEAASRVLSAAASRGFASRAYRDVHQDYHEVVEADLDRQKIPPGQRTYVRRYFDLIRPR